MLTATPMWMKAVPGPAFAALRKRLGDKTGPSLVSGGGASSHPAISAMRLAIRLAAAFSGSFARCA